MIRRVVNVPPAVAEETVVSTPSTSELVEDDAPPVISRFDNSTYPPSTVSPPPVPGPHRIVLNRAAPVVSNNQKVLLIRRNDGTTQYLRPVANPARGIEPACRIGEAPPTMRRVVASVTAGRPGTVVRTVAAGQPTRVVRVGPGGQQIVNRLSGTRVMATRTPQGLEASTLRQSQAPVGAVQQQTRIVQRVLTRGGATMAMGQRIVSSHEDIGLTRPLKNPREFGYKPRVVPDVARSSYSSRPYRFDFESNEDEERAIAEAIAREEELMAQEEEENKNNQERQWNYPRIIDKFGQVGTAMLHNLARQPLQYNSNLMPTKEDTQEQKQIKQTLDSLVTQVCRWDKQFGWFKNHQKKPKNRAEMDKMKSRRMFSNQRELMLAEHVERLRREINKRRTRLENDAEQECGLQTPWRKGKAKTPKSKRPVKKAPNAPIVNPAEISLGGDSIDWMKKEIKIEEDELVEDVCSSSQPPSKKSRLEVETSPRRKPASVPRSDRVLRTRMNSHSSVEEGSSKKDAPKKRGRPKKEALSSQDSEDSDTAGVDYGIPEGMTDPKAPHCICRKPYNSKRFYISCDMCNGWFHGKCVGVKSKDCESLTSWACPDCKQQTEQIQQNDLYCLCQKPYDDREFYVGCDKCEDWFHPECVGITKEFLSRYAESIAEYVCPPCRTAAEQSATDGYESTASEASTSSSSPPLSRADYPKVWQLLDTISHHKMAWPFKEPVDLAKHPDYTDLVKRPMDLKTIQNKLERLEYIKLKDFSYDCNLMFENARAYYTKDSPIYLCATTLEKIFEDNLIEVKKEMARAYNIDRRKPSESHTVDSSLDIDTDQLIELQHDGIANGNFDITQYI